MQRFEGRTVLVTGASSGIGAATAARLATEGARIIGASRDLDRLKATAESWPGSEMHRLIAADVSSEESITALFAVIKEGGSGLDSAVFAAGQHLLRPLAMTKAQHVEDILRSNVVSTLLCTKEFGKLPGGANRSVVWLSSAAAFSGGATEAIYAGAKAALIASCRSLAVEVGAKYRVNCVAPGVVRTKMSDAWLGKLMPEQQQAVEKRHPLGFGTPEDIAAAIAFLASDDAKWITGTCLVADGGLTCH